MDFSALLLLDSLLALFGWGWWRSGLRTREFRSLAQESGLNYKGSTKPATPELSGTPLDGISDVWNVMEGDRDGKKTVVFDCMIGRGRESRRRTVIAVNGDAGKLVDFAREPGIAVERAKEWTLVYPDVEPESPASELISAEQLQHYLAVI